MNPTIIVVATLLGTAVPLAARLTETGLYVGRDVTRIAPENLSFTPQYPLWSDGADKRRFVQLPAGTRIDARQSGAWRFAPGTRFWKEFSFAGRRVETRLLEQLPDGRWRYATYVWKSNGEDAFLAPPEGVPDAFELRPGLFHAIPSEADCRACHEGGASPVLGFSALQLSADRDPGAPHREPGAALDLAELARRDLIEGLDHRLLAQPPRIPAASAAARAALGYLHANCGHCHNDKGPLAVLSLSLDQAEASPLAVAATLDSTVGKPSRWGSAPAAMPVRVAPGRPSASSLLRRMRSRQPHQQMPPLGSRLVDGAGVAVIARWIAQLNQEIGP